MLGVADKLAPEQLHTFNIDVHEHINMGGAERVSSLIHDEVHRRPIAFS